VILYTIGYNNFSFFEFSDKIKELGAIIIDVRYSPRSYNPFWGKKYLEDRFGNSYIHIPELGNKNYKNPDKEFDIVDIEKGFQEVSQYLDMEIDCVLMCACEDVEKCHRRIVSEYIGGKTSAKIIHL